MALNNPLSNFGQSILGNLTGLINGQNPPTQPQIANILGFNLPGVPLFSSRDYFLIQLQSWLSTPSLQSQWIVVFDDFPPPLSNRILSNLERTNGDSNIFSDLTMKALKSYPFQKVSGCVFATEVTIPEESVTVGYASVENRRGFIPGVIGGERGNYSAKPLSIYFYDNNTTFTDFIMRPWVMLTAHYGLISRSKNLNVKTNITIIQYARTYQNVSMIPRKTFRFYNCAPISVAQQTYDYEEKSNVQSWNVNFTYSNYTVKDSLYFPVPQIINYAKRK
jgi:hypothetical protein